MKFQGVWPAVVTPLDKNNKLMEDGARALVRHHIKNGADGLYVCGSTGESMLLEKEVRKAMCEICVEEAKGKIPVIIHVGANNLDTAKELARHAETCGADAIASVPPGYFAYGAKDVYNYYTALAASTELPVMIYYVLLGGTSMDAEVFRDIYKDCDNVTSLKWTSPNFYEMMNVKTLTNGEINIMSGPDEMMVCGLAAGADGAIGSTYNIMYRHAKSIYESFMAGNVRDAREKQMEMNKVIRLLLSTGGFHSALKYILSLQGIDVGDTTYPLHQLNEKEKETIHTKLMELGFQY